jgi:putative DNA primase/helicase
MTSRTPAAAPSHALLPPDCVKEVIVCANADASGEHAAEEAAHRFVQEGRRVCIALPRIGRGFKEMTL